MLQPSLDHIQVLAYALPAAALAVGINSQLWQLLGSSSSSSDDTSTAITTTTTSSSQLALLHLSQEAVLALLLPAACRLALGPRVTAAEASPYWALQTLGTCAVLFPLVDPLLSSLWQPVATVRRLQRKRLPRPTNQPHSTTAANLGPVWLTTATQLQLLFISRPKSNLLACTHTGCGGTRPSQPTGSHAAAGW